MVDEHYFETMGIPLLEGRNFRAEDTAATPRVAIVNQHLAQHYWPNQGPLGKRFLLDDVEKRGSRSSASPRPPNTCSSPNRPGFVYLPYRRRAAADGHGRPGRRRLEPGGAAARGRARPRLESADFNVRTMEEFYRMRAVSIFNVLVGTWRRWADGTGLSIVGLYGLVAYAAAGAPGNRYPDGIGATRQTVLRMVLRQGMVLALVGLVVGLFASVGAGELLRAAFPQRRRLTRSAVGGDGRADRPGGTLSRRATFPPAARRGSTR